MISDFWKFLVNDMIPFMDQPDQNLPKSQSLDPFCNGDGNEHLWTLCVLVFFLQNLKAFINFCRCPMLSQLPRDKVFFCFKYCASGVYVQFSFIFVKLVSLVLWMLASNICSKVNFVSYVSINEHFGG